MPRTCTVCSDPEVLAINEAIVLEGRSNRNIAKQFGPDWQAIRRHREHIPELLVKAAEAQEIAEADDLLAEVRALHERTLAILEAAEETEELRTALGAIREARGNLELLAKIRQLIDQAPRVNVLIDHPEWVELRTVLITALERHPEAREDVLRAIEEATSAA